ncbi:C40 family peptidase [Lapidilactobacillus luobeiensis]|uniref:C40 family peptidase n=1 Tax=Lapidilactobacillus luobeiensis TaxID=2950371 RepID=UPI0035A25225
MGVSSVSADEVSNAQSSIASKKSANNDLLSQLSEQQNQVAKLSNAVSNKVLAINAANDKIVTIEGAIKKSDQEITVAKKELKNRKSVLREQLKSLQNESSNSVTGNVYVDFVLSADSLSEALSRSVAVRSLNTANKDAMDAVNESKASIETLRTKQADQKSSLVATKAKLVTEKASLDSQKDSAQAAQAALAKKIDDNKAEIAKLQSDVAAAAAAATSRVATTTATTRNSTATVKTAQSSNNSAPSVVGGTIASNAAKYIGVPYVWGGTSPAGFDCSGLIYYAAAQAGISLPRTSEAMSRLGSYVSVGSLQAGDLVFWGGVGSAYHVGVYVGGGRYIHSPAPGQSVTSQSVSGWAPSFGKRL